MIKWITSRLGTCGMTQLPALKEGQVIVDVRDMVDKEGNSFQLIDDKISETISLLDQNKTVIICCDYGLSRSNSIAVGVMMKWKKMSFDDAVRAVVAVVDEKGIKLGMLSSVFKAMGAASQAGHKKSGILVTGSTGFIGKSLLQDESKNDGLNFIPIPHDNFDLRNNILILDSLVKTHSVKAILHLANPRVYTNNDCIGDSILMLKNVLDVCKENNLKLIYVSSWEVFSGYVSSELCADENVKPFPKGTYGESKWLGDQLVEQYSKLYDLEFLTLRSSPIYGTLSDKPKFMYTFITKALNGDPIFTHRYKNGSASLDLLYIDDFVDGLRAAIRSSCNGVFHFGSGEYTSTHAVAELIIKETGSPSKLDFHDVDATFPGLRMNYAKATRLLNWRPKVRFQEGLRRLLENRRQA
jgi:nucleoside-diphosphate-sugar epimerase